MDFLRNSKNYFIYSIFAVAITLLGYRLTNAFFVTPTIVEQIHVFLSALDTPIHYLLFLGVFLVFKKTINKFDLLIIFSIAYLFSAFDLLGILYDFVTQDFKVSNLLNYKFTNCQYIKLSITLFVWMAVFYINFWKSQRSFSRIFYLVLVLSYYIFVFIAHLAVVDLNLKTVQNNARLDLEQIIKKVDTVEAFKSVCDRTKSVCEEINLSELENKLDQMQSSRKIGLVHKYDIKELASEINESGIYSLNQLDVIFDYTEDKDSISHIVIFKKIDNKIHVLMEKQFSAATQYDFMRGFVLFQYLFIISWFVCFTYLGYRHDIKCMKIVNHNML